MKSGYDQFFKQAQKNAFEGKKPLPKIDLEKLSLKNSKNTKELVNELRNRKERPKPQRRIRKTPWQVILSSFLGLGLAGAGLMYLDQIEGLFKRVEISLLGPVNAEDKKPEASKAEHEKKADAKAPQVEEAAAGDKTKEYSPEQINHFSKLNEKKRELDAREEELNRAEGELQTQKTELEKKMTELEGTRRSIASILDEKVKVDDQKIETLVQMYSNMKAQQAAKIFETMDEDLAVAILGRMKKKNAAEVMNLMKPERAQLFSEKYAGYKKK